MNILVKEYESFKRLTDALAAASSAARDVGTCRPDQSHQWDKVAETLTVTRTACFHLAGEGTVGKHRG